MTFEPAQTTLKHLASTQNDTHAHNWLRCLQGDPFPDTRTLFALSCDPEPPQRSSRKTTLPNGPIAPTALCPETGRTLKLHIFKDLSAVLMRQGNSEDVAWEVFPAALGIPSQIHDINIKKANYERRPAEVAILNLQALPDGLYWSKTIPASSPTEQDAINSDFVQSLFSSRLPDLALSILGSPPVADPRSHRKVPKGARFAPFSIWPDKNLFHNDVQRLEALITAFIDFHVEECSSSSTQVYLFRHSPDTPWRRKNRTSQVVVNHGPKNLGKAIRRLISHPQCNFPDALLCGDDNDLLCSVGENKGQISHHTRLEALKTLSDILGDKSWHSLYVGQDL